MSNDRQSAFSEPFSVDDLKTEAKIDVEADAAERAALSARLNVVSIDKLEGNLHLTRELGAVIHLHGSLNVELTQSCIVTLEPLETVITLEIDRRFGPPELAEEDVKDLEIAFDEDDPPDVIEDGIIDVGEALIEQLTLEIDPFPRADGAEFTGFSKGPLGAKTKESPFAALEGLVKKPK